MHELSVCLALLQQVEKIAQERNAIAIHRIEIEIGPLAGIESELLRNAYPLAAAGTVASDAQLSISASPIKVRCNACGEESQVEANRLLCSSCGDFQTTLVSGDELLLKRLELTPGNAG